MRKISKILMPRLFADVPCSLFRLVYYSTHNSFEA